jgi:acetyl-CoA carboxylase biotin carboxyl carrier protein
MDIRKVKKLIELLEESNIDEIEIKEGEESVRISRNGASQNIMAAPYPAMAPAYAAPAPAALAPVAAAPVEPVVAEAPAIEGHAVRSPMVGTFYQWASQLTSVM